MQLAVALSRESVQQKTGGPFGAVVVNDHTGALVSVGINLVTTAGLSIAHAEMVALSLAQLSVGQWNLSHSGPLQLVTSCEPCAMSSGKDFSNSVNAFLCSLFSSNSWFFITSSFILGFDFVSTV